jgi:hypothetical protein
VVRHAPHRVARAELARREPGRHHDAARRHADGLHPAVDDPQPDEQDEARGQPEQDVRDRRRDERGREEPARAGPVGEESARLPIAYVHRKIVSRIPASPIVSTPAEIIESFDTDVDSRTT